MAGRWFWRNNGIRLVAKGGVVEMAVEIWHEEGGLQNLACEGVGLDGLQIGHM